MALDSPSPSMPHQQQPRRRAGRRFRRHGSQALLPKVRAAGDDVLLVVSGFSCREQIRQCAQRMPLDLAEVLRMALRAHAPPGHSSPPQPLSTERHDE